MAIEQFDLEVFVQEPGDRVLDEEVSQLIYLHRDRMVERSPEEVDEFSGKAVAVRARHPETGEMKLAAYVAYTGEYEDQGRLLGELGAVVTSPDFNGYRRQLAALAILKLMDLDITDRYDEVFSLVLNTNTGSLRLFDGLPNATPMNPATLPSSVFSETINGQPDRPENYHGYGMRRAVRQAMLNSPVSQTTI